MDRLVKCTFFIICFTAYCLPANGQAVLALLFGKNIKNDNLSLGIHVGLESSNLTNTPGSKQLLGLALGAYTNVKFSDHWMLSNYFIFKSSRGATYIPLDHQLQPNVPGASNAEIKRDLTYLEISPLFRYNITHELSIAAGPQMAIRTIAKDKYLITLADGGEETIVYNTKDHFQWFDLDAAADIQYAFYGGKGIRLNFRFSQGFLNVYKDTVPFQAKNQYFQLGVGIPIATGSTKQ